MRKFKYLVSYNYTNNNSFGFGMCKATTTKRIKNYEHLEKISEGIRKKTKMQRSLHIKF